MSSVSGSVCEYVTHSEFRLFSGLFHLLHFPGPINLSFWHPHSLCVSQEWVTGWILLGLCCKCRQPQPGINLCQPWPQPCASGAFGPPRLPISETVYSTAPPTPLLGMGVTHWSKSSELPPTATEKLLILITCPILAQHLLQLRQEGWKKPQVQMPQILTILSKFICF